MFFNKLNFKCFFNKLLILKVSGLTMIQKLVKSGIFYICYLNHRFIL